MFTVTNTGNTINSNIKKQTELTHCNDNKRWLRMVGIPLNTW